MHGLTRFLGDTPLRIFVRLLALSFIVGLVLASLNIRPWQVYDWVRRAILRINDMGLAAFVDAFDYLIAGALIVVPLFLLVRLFKLGGRRRAE